MERVSLKRNNEMKPACVAHSFAAMRWLLALALLVAPALALAAPAWINLAPPPQSSYTVPASYSVVLTSGNGVQGSSVETINGVKIFRNGQVAASYGRSGTLLEGGLSAGTYTYYAEGNALSIVRGEERVRTLRTPEFTITVNPPPALYNEAQFVSQSLPAGYTRLFSGQTMPLSVQMRNNGTTTWSASHAYALGSQSPQDNWNWGMGRVALPHDVAPGETVTFNMTLTAPQVTGAGNVSVQWRMVQDGVEWFGQASAPGSIDVRPAPVGSISALPNPCELSVGATICATTVRWEANTLNANTEVWRSDLNGNGAVRMITADSGTLNVTDITEAGSRFRVIGYGQVLASVDVVGRRPQPVITGNIDGLTSDGGALIGWACATAHDAPIDVQMYVGGPAGAAGSVLIGIYPANQASEASVATACKVDSNNHRFAIPISNELRAQYSGRLIYVYGVSPVGAANLAVNASGRYGVPAPTVPIIQPNTRRYVYDDQQRLCKVIEQETGATVTAYDDANNVVWTASGLNLPATDNCNRAEASASGRAVFRTYDARKRLKTLVFPDGRGNQVWEYALDGLPSKVVTYNEPDNTEPVENIYTYNKRRMMIGEAVAQPGLYRWDLGYGYDRIGNPASQVYPNGLAVTFEPDALGQPKRMSSPGAVYASQIDYYPNGGLQRFVYGNGIVHTMTQNLRQLPRRSTEAGVIDLETVYDANGNVSAIYDRARGDHYNRIMEYDGLERLKAAGSCSFGGDCWHRFTYDAQGNLRSWVLPGIKDYATYVYDEHSRLTNIRNGAGESVVGLGYDVQGNLENKNGQVYVFDYGNRLRASLGQESYRYDAEGRRALSIFPDGNTRVISQYSKVGQLVYEQDLERGVDAANIFLRGELLAIRERARDATGAEHIYYQHTDALGSPVAVTDAAGLLLNRTEYEPFGKVMNDPGYDGIGYAGHVMDRTTGLVQMQQRYYDPNVGRFLSVDPVVALGGDMRHFNRYAYAYNNPYSFTDPDGRQGEFIALRWALAFAAADAATPDPSDAAAPGKAMVYGSAIAGTAIGGGLFWLGNRAIESMSSSSSGGGDSSSGSGSSSEASSGSAAATPPPDDDDNQFTRHGKERSDEARTDANRNVGDSNRVVREGRAFTDTETGNTVHVNGNRVVVRSPEGKIVTQFTNSRANTATRIRTGRWEPKK
jgi:RHS repeat-associated protein